MRARSRALLVALFSLLVTLAPAHAGATRFEILASAAQNATGNGGAISVSGIKELVTYFDCTASSGTGETLDMLLQSSSDGGTNWYDLPYELGQVSDGDGTETATTTNKRDFVELAADVACTGVKSVAKYQLFGDLVRARWFIAGTTPSYTFSLRAIGK